MPTPMGRIRTSSAVQTRAKELRQQMTPPETLMWEHLRGRRLNGLKFRRQHPLGLFIADFYCAEYRLVVEIDGGVHQNQSDRDAQRTQQFVQYGYRVLRFRNEAIERDINRVLNEIADACR